MNNGKDTVTSDNLIDLIVKGIQNKKGEDIVLLNLKEIGNAVADYFVICTGNSDTQIDAIASNIEKEVYLTAQQDPWKKEGYKNKDWILIDYVDVVVHIFKRDIREFYALEDLWGDAVHTFIENEN